MVLSATAFAAPSSSASWTPFGGASTFERYTDADLTELPVGAMLVVVTVGVAPDPCYVDFKAGLGAVANSKPADSPPMVLWCQEPPPTYDACIAAARIAFDAADDAMRAAYATAVSSAKFDAGVSAGRAAEVGSDCADACLSVGGPHVNACLQACHVAYCNSLGSAGGVFDTAAAAAESDYIVARGANHQTYVDAQGACCDG